MEKKHSEKEKTSLDSPSPKLNKSMIAYHETGDLFADTCEIVESAQSIAYAAADTILVQKLVVGKRIAIECLNEMEKPDYGKKTIHLQLVCYRPYLLSLLTTNTVAYARVCFFS